MRPRTEAEEVENFAGSFEIGIIHRLRFWKRRCARVLMRVADLQKPDQEAEKYEEIWRKSNVVYCGDCFAVCKGAKGIGK